MRDIDARSEDFGTSLEVPKRRGQWTAPKSFSPDRASAAPQKDRRTEARQAGLEGAMGRRVVKIYPVTSNELWTLGGSQLGAHLFFWLAGVCLGTGPTGSARSASPAAPTRRNWPSGGCWVTWALAGASLCGLIGTALFLMSAWSVLCILRNTSHDAPEAS
ncbi:MAG: hypothetical protein WDN24_00145 [Sphingomonas sp.]